MDKYSLINRGKVPKPSQKMEKMEKIEKAIILAGGIGKRLQPITFSIPKVLVPINGKPVIDFIVEKLEALGVGKIGIVVSYKKEQIIEHFGDKFYYFEQKEPLGTANAIATAEEFINEKEKFLVINGDIFFTDDLKGLVDLAPPVVSVYQVKDGANFGKIFTKGNIITEIREKDGVSEPAMINAGVYLFDSRIFEAIKLTEKSSRGEYEITDSLKILMKKAPLSIYKLKGYWKDIGRLEDLKEVEDFVKNEQKKKQKE